MPNPLVVNAAELLRRAGSDRTVEVDVALDDLGVQDARFPDGASVAVQLHLESNNDGIDVTGELRTPWHGTCRRCLAETSGVAVSEVHERYQRVLTDPDAFELTGDQLDLQPLVRELVLLDAPATPLCRDDCPGLCPTCGARLADGPCGCAPVPADDRWAALDALRDQLGEDPETGR